ncbi:Dbl homology domain-containing protein, partial [Teratosphaeria nubilosa]
MSSFAGSTRHSSVDNSNDGQARQAKAVSSNPDQKRLMKRRHIIKELVDTENTYHQDLKIIEDIYRATAADLLSAEDRKTLFGNCDEIERFSIHFYDELRKAVATVYVPPKGIRWGNKRGSYSTTQSDGTGQTSTNTDPVDEEKDRITSVGSCFLANLQRMDQVYGAYLKNHDAANQRLSALKSTSTVKCWLDECHNNASDITSAWDLDSLLVKPTQRVSKYPMLLQQLLETTPTSHPDHEALKTAAKDSIGMLTRINEAKKRADIVDQIINRKDKEEFRTGLAKAFGRRTEKLKERVGIAEAFQDVEFDELSHKFGGHFIRLQICMRDVQDYLHRIDKTIDQIVNCASAFEHFTDVMTGSLPEVEKKWRNYSQCIVEVANIAYPEHKAAVQKRVIQPMVTCIRLHEGPQNAINKRKKRIVDYAKCKSIEKRGERPDKKTLEASEMYEALNEQLKIELPQLYTLTAHLVQACLNCFLDIQQKWYNMWERKLRPVLEDCAMPTSIQQIEPAFQSDFSAIKNKLVALSICNGALLAD